MPRKQATMEDTATRPSRGQASALHSQRALRVKRACREAACPPLGLAAHMPIVADPFGTPMLPICVALLLARLLGPTAYMPIVARSLGLAALEKLKC